MMPYCSISTVPHSKIMMIMHDYACIHMRVIQDDGYLNTFCVCLIHKVAVQANVLIHPYVPCSKYGWASISWESLYAGYKNSWIDDQPPMGKIQYPTNSTMAAMAPLPSAGTSVLLSPGSTWPFSTPPFFHGSCCIILNWRPSWSPQPQVLHAHVAGALMFTEVKSQVGILSILEPTRTSEVHFRLVYFSGWPENYGTAGETLQFDTIWLNDASSWNLRLTAQG